MAQNYTLWLPLFLIGIGLLGALIKRDIFQVMMSIGTAILGIILFMATSGKMTEIGFLLIVIFSAQTLLGCSVAIFTYRQRSSVNLDELRESRG